jgi:TetR/AcrR family acrAB operon transcriptional repressor
VRRTKEQAEQTRQTIMAAALRTFNRHGISRTTMQEIAKAARVTRGAIYWHFQNKHELLRAIRQEVSLPLIDRSDFTLLSDRAADPLERVRRFLLDLVQAVEEDSRTRLTCQVMFFKCEYVGELKGELKEYARKNERVRKMLAQVYVEAYERNQLRAGLTPELAALETTVFLAGLMRLCLLDEGFIQLRKQASRLVAAHIDGRRIASAALGGAHGRRKSGPGDFRR